MDNNAVELVFLNIAIGFKNVFAQQNLSIIQKFEQLKN